jgi:hypothetical protein
MTLRKRTHNAECRYVECYFLVRCHFAARRILNVVMLSVSQWAAYYAEEKKFYNTDPAEQMVKKQQINFLKEKVFILGISTINIFKRGSRCFGTASTLNYFHFGHQN